MLFLISSHWMTNFERLPVTHAKITPVIIEDAVRKEKQKSEHTPVIYLSKKKRIKQLRTQTK